MARQIMIKVSKRGGPSVKVPFEVPETVEEWQKRAANGEADRDKLAVQQLVVKAQAGAREYLDDKAPDKGASKVAEYLANYVYDAKRERTPKVKRANVKVPKQAKKDPMALIAALREQLAAQGVEVDFDEGQ